MSPLHIISQGLIATYVLLRDRRFLWEFCELRLKPLLSDGMRVNSLTTGRSIRHSEREAVLADVHQRRKVADPNSSGDRPLCNSGASAYATHSQVPRSTNWGILD